MKRIVDGVVYNIKKATLVYKIVATSDSLPRFESKLYKTPKGNWFVINSGGAAPASSGLCKGKRLLPYTITEVLAWCERYCVPVKIISEYIEFHEA